MNENQHNREELTFLPALKLSYHFVDLGSGAAAPEEEAPAAPAPKEEAPERVTMNSWPCEAMGESQNVEELLPLRTPLRTCGEQGKNEFVRTKKNHPQSKHTPAKQIENQGGVAHRSSHAWGAWRFEWIQKLFPDVTFIELLLIIVYYCFIAR